MILNPKTIGFAILTGFLASAFYMIFTAILRELITVEGAIVAFFMGIALRIFFDLFDYWNSYKIERRLHSKTFSEGKKIQPLNE